MGEWVAVRVVKQSARLEREAGSAAGDGDSGRSGERGLRHSLFLVDGSEVAK